jgi:TonB-dependent receptor
MTSPSWPLSGLTLLAAAAISLPTLLPAQATSATPPAAPLAPVPAASAGEEQPIALDTFVVNAYTDERNRSVEAKRNAESIGDFLSTDRLGLFVDNNIGAVVERLPGVYTSGAGQSGGSGISIRGFGGGFNSLQVDGDRIPSNQGGTRGVSIDNVPAELIGAIEIFKAPTPEKEADSIGGVINVETKSGLDLKKRLIATRFVYGFDDYGSGRQWGGSVSHSERLSDTVGSFFSLSYRDNTRQRDEIRADPADYVFDQLVTTNSALPQLTPTASTRVFMPSRTDFRRTVQSQQNTGANLNLDWQASRTLRLSLRTFFAQFEEQRPQIRNLWRHDRSTGNDPVNRTFPHPEYVYLDEADRIFYFGNEQRIVRRIADQEETEKIMRLQLEAAHRWPDALLDYSVSFGRAERDMVNSTYNFTADDIQLRADLGSSLYPSFDVIRPGAFFYNTSANPRVPNFNDATYYGPTGAGYFNITERRAEAILAEDQIRTLAANYRKQFTNGLILKTGAKIRQQEKDNQRDFVINPGFTFSAANARFEAQDGFFNGFANLGLYPTHGSLFEQNPTTPRQFIDTVLGGTPSADNRRESTIQDLAASEDVLGLYAQASRQFGRLTILGGARWEHTASTYGGFTADVTGNPAIDATRSVRGSRGYDGVYPSIHANLALTERTALRLAIGRTLARPEFQDLTPSSFATLSVDSGSGAATVNLQRGNAALRPTESLNYDLSLEHYFRDGGVFSFAVFHKEMTNWIYRSDFIAPPAQFPEYAAIPNLTAVRVASTLNGDQAKVTGFEVNLEKTIGWGFSLGANYTLLSFDVNRAQTGLDRVPGQSDRLIRASLSYEAKKFITRLSYRDSGSTPAMRPMSVASVAAVCGTSPTRRPARMTRMRRHNPINSGSSEETTRMALPWQASSSSRG